MLPRSELADAPIKPETGTRVEKYGSKPTEWKLPSLPQERTRVGLLHVLGNPIAD